ncbi:hypothetical protein Ocin01_02172 [Orchesella cincta]|uniref:Uncharacterized protein n=1 Tax=Orchesella cincta TaxID=48709 RepID=A0A1D2NGT0_ORCCI|nr:hypothetical protein Ocin01_02172 [Orchesella cincta]
MSTTLNKHYKQTRSRRHFDFQGSTITSRSGVKIPVMSMIPISLMPQKGAKPTTRTSVMTSPPVRKYVAFSSSRGKSLNTSSEDAKNGTTKRPRSRQHKSWKCSGQNEVYSFLAEEPQYVVNGIVNDSGGKEITTSVADSGFSDQELSTTSQQNIKTPRKFNISIRQLANDSPLRSQRGDDDGDDECSILRWSPNVASKQMNFSQSVLEF